MATGSRKRKILSLEEKVRVIQRSEKNNESARKIAESLGVGKTQIQNIILDKESIITAWQSGMGKKRKYVKAKRCVYEDINELVWEWFCIARSKNIPITGKLIQEKALMISRVSAQDMSNFKASNGWLQSWQQHYNVKYSVLRGEGAEVSTDDTNDWTQRLISLCDGYSRSDIFNADETGLMYRTLPTRSMVQKGDCCKGDKKAKERITVLLCCSATGEKIKPLVIGKSQNPRCFREVNRATMGIEYEANSMAWMTSATFSNWVSQINQKFKNENRNVLMFIDNCSAHSDIEASNLKLVFLPPTSKLQPMDAGIIQAVKTNYRKKFLRHILCRMDECTAASELAKRVNVLDASELAKRVNVLDASELAKRVNVLDAIKWIKASWDELSASTIEKCFIFCGFKEKDDSADSDSTSQSEPSEGPVDEIAGQELLDGLPFNDFLTFDNTLSTSVTIEGDWEQTIMDKAKGVINETQDESSNEDEEPDDDTLIGDKEAFFMVNELKKYALSRNEIDLTQALTEAEKLIEHSVLKEQH